MAESYISTDLEFLEVLNTFPILKSSFEKLNMNISNIDEGETIEHYFLEKKNLEKEELSILLRKLNFEVNSFLKDDGVKILKEEKIILNHEEEEE